MSGAEGYRDGVALRSAVTSRAKEAARTTRADQGALVRRFVYERFLARVFHDSDSPWVLKGGTAVLARVNDARTTKDVDLLAELDNLDIALGRLRGCAAVDLGDHFRFVITGHDASMGGAGQPHVGGYRVHVDAYCGAVKKQTFGVDLVTGSLMTTSPEIDTPPAVLQLRGLTPPTLRLYPVVDHIADKLCATQATYGASGTLASSRVRDLVDLVVLARTQDVDGDRLIVAIGAEWTHWSLPGKARFAPPTSWNRLYPPIAKAVPACDGLTTFAAATQFVSTFLDPALNRTATGKRWVAADSAWR